MKTTFFHQEIMSKIRLIILVCLTHVLTYAQSSLYPSSKTYASGQIYNIVQPCINCQVQNPQNMVGSNETDYADIIQSAGNSGTIEQTIIFPAATKAYANKVVIGAGTEGMTIQSLAAGNISITTYLGDTSNNDTRQATPENIKIENQLKGTIEFVPLKKFDRIRISFKPSAYYNQHTKIFYAYHTPNPKVYATSQSNQTSGICLLCSIENPQNAIGNNEMDYASIKIPVGIASGIEQTLSFPASVVNKKIVIGIGTGNTALNFQLLGGTFIETFLGNTSNNDKKKVDNTMLKTDPNSKTGTIEFIPSKAFDKIKIYFNGGLLGIGDELRIYYIYHTPTFSPFTTCGSAPPDAIAYYPFNGNTKDVISGIDLTTLPTTYFENGLVCDRGLNINTSKEIKTESNPLLAGKKTLSFWAKATNGEIIIPAYQSAFHIIHDTVAVYSFPDIAVAVISHLSQPLRHYAITYENLNTTAGPKIKSNLYINGKPISPTPFLFSRGNFIEDQIILKINKAEMDELIVYNRVLEDDEIQSLACSYGKIPNCMDNTPVPDEEDDERAIHKKVKPEKETFTISPNPTSGQITLDGNILMIGSEISIRNTSGTEVYHAPFRSKTFELPTSLPGGIYMLTLQTKDKKIYTRKIILNR